jgi:hypothetical protein
MLIPHTRNSFQMATRSDLLSNKPLERPGMIAPLDVEAASAGRSAPSRSAKSRGGVVLVLARLPGQ